MRHWFDRLASIASRAMGSFGGFLAICLLVGVCLALVPLLGWMLAQLVLTTALTVLTQLTAQLLTHASARQEAAVQAKLDELIRAIGSADNRLRGIENIEP
jgi:low affinity Fe/Cu permease